jgi:hypothetical protein
LVIGRNAYAAPRAANDAWYPQRRRRLKQTLSQENYLVYSLELAHDETSFASVEEIANYFKHCIEEHRCACFIAEFDHYAHTRSLPEGRIDDNIRAAKNVVFCFGITLPDPHVLAVRPRSIGIAETPEGFLVTFMEAPMPIANTVMERWAEGLRMTTGERRPDRAWRRGEPPRS